MIERLRRLLGDPSVRWLAGARVIALLAAPLSLYLLVTRQPLSARGFYLIAINVVALAQLFETGMGTLVVQFAARVRPSERGALRAAAERWYGRAAAAFLAIGATVGSYVFATGAGSASVDFAVPWTIVLLATAAYIRLVPLVCLREGGGDGEGVQRMRAAQALLVAAATVFGLWSGPGIRAAAWAAVAQLTVGGVFALNGRRHLPAADASGERITAQYTREQGRSARVWIALWIGPQLLTPAVMFLRDASSAGDIGLHVALSLAPAVLAVAWMHARYPRLGALVASGALRTFDDTARHSFTQAAWVFLGTSIVLVALAVVGPHFLPFLAGRVLSPVLLVTLLAGSFVPVVLQAMLAWLRAFGDEKFAQPVVMACGGMAAGGVCGAAIAGSFGAALGYSAVGVGVAAILVAGFLRLRAHQLTAG